MTLGIINQGKCGPGLLNNWLKYNYTVLYFKHEFLNTLQLLLLSSIQVKTKHCSAELKYMQPIFSSKLILYFRVYPENSRFSLSRPPRWGISRAGPWGADPCVTWERESDSKLRVLAIYCWSRQRAELLAPNSVTDHMQICFKISFYYFTTNMQYNVEQNTHYEDKGAFSFANTHVHKILNCALHIFFNKLVMRNKYGKCTEFFTFTICTYTHTNGCEQRQPQIVIYSLYYLWRYFFLFFFFTFF